MVRCLAPVFYAARIAAALGTARRCATAAAGCSREMRCAAPAGHGSGGVWRGVQSPTAVCRALPCAWQGCPSARQTGRAVAAARGQPCSQPAASFSGAVGARRVSDGLHAWSPYKPDRRGHDREARHVADRHDDRPQYQPRGEVAGHEDPLVATRGTWSRRNMVASYTTSRPREASGWSS